MSVCLDEKNNSHKEKKTKMSKSYKLFIIEVLAVALMTTVIGTIISFIFMGEKAKQFHHWKRVMLAYAVTGALIHIICQVTKVNHWYCQHGYACLSQ